MSLSVTPQQRPGGVAPSDALNAAEANAPAGSLVRMQRGAAVGDQLATVATKAQLEKFGCRDGVAVSNKETILNAAWSAIGGKPKLIYGLAEMGSNFGHAFVALETHNPATGKVEFMVPNIVGGPNETMVQWIGLNDYLFGVNDFKAANRQRGVYNRPYTLVALNDAPIDTETCKAYFDNLLKRNERGEAKFILSLPRVVNVLTAPLRWLGLSKTEYGNCARWNAEGLKAAGVFRPQSGLSNFFTHNTMWPKRLAVRLIEGRSRVQTSNVHVIHLPRIPHAHVTARGLHEGQTYANALTFLAGKLGFSTPRGRELAQLANVAEVQIVVPERSIKAQVVVEASR